MKKVIVIITLLLAVLQTAWSENSSDFYVVDTDGNNGNGNNHTNLNAIGEPIVGVVSNPDHVVGIGFLVSILQNSSAVPTSDTTPTITITFTHTPFVTKTQTPTITVTPLDDYGRRLITPKYTYTAPNPVRGHHMKFVVHVQEAVEIEVKMFTTSNKFVLKFSMNCPGPGKYEHREYVGNLANGVYLLLVKAKNNSGKKDRLIKKIGLIK